MSSELNCNFLLSEAPEVSDRIHINIKKVCVGVCVPLCVCAG